MPDLLKKSPFGDDAELQMIVETPRGSSVKLKFEPKLEIFTVARALPLGLTYPFDWGFIPGTEGEDGDPIDALALHDASTFPGVLLPCRALGVEIDQRGKNGGREANPRLILMPVWHDRLGEMEKAAELPQRLKQEIEQFFLSATFFTGKDARLKGWRGPKAAEKLIRSQRS
jgi:inorganic pyrophosphatase